MVKSINNCILCNSVLPDIPLISFNNMPASAQDIPNAEEMKEDMGITLNLYQCPRCSLVQLDSSPVHYYKDVIRAGGGSSTMKELRKEEYKDFIERFDLYGKKILEVGCGKGEFLSLWKEFDVQCIGIENSSDLVAQGRSQGLNIIHGFMNDPNMKLKNGPFDAFCQFNFLEHQPRPNEMLQTIYNNLTDEGVGLITVPSLEYILTHNGYYELIRDHLAYYSESSLKLLFENNGFDVVKLKTVNRDTHEIQVRKRNQINLSNWIYGYEKLREEIIEFINDNGGETAIWGASHQGFTLIPSMHLEPFIKCIIDSAPFKQGRYAPASHIPIISPNEFCKRPTKSIIIVAPGYTEEIYKCIRQEFGMDIVVATLRSNSLEILK